MDKKTKILATLGPSSNSLEMIEKLIDAGANMFRLNFSHGSHEYHQETLDNIRQAMQNKKKIVGILQDISGPKIRVGELKEPFLLELKNREKFFFFFYFVLSNLFFGYIFLYRIPLYLLDFLRTYPYELVEFINNFNGNSFPGYQEINLILSKFFIGVLLIYFCYNTLKRIINIKL